MKNHDKEQIKEIVDVIKDIIVCNHREIGTKTCQVLIERLNEAVDQLDIKQEYLGR